MNFSELSLQAEKAYLLKDFDSLFNLTEILICSENNVYTATGYFLRGAYYEYYDSDSAHLLKALEQYYHTEKLNPTDIIYVTIANVLIKSGIEFIPDALKYLKMASEISKIPEIDLGLATIYTKMQPPNYCLAKLHYFNAAKSGRVQGVFGYAMASRKLGQNFRAMLADAYRIISSPILYLFIGKKLTKGFWI